MGVHRHAGRSAVIVALAALWLGTGVAPVSADDADDYQHTIVVDPDRSTGSTADCLAIPPVHHRMWGIRGAREGDGNENTIWGMQQTYDDGVRWFETDLQVLLSEAEARARDNGTYRGGHHGELVLFHDFTLRRTTNATGILRRRAYSELPRTTTGRRIPTLGEAFSWLKDHPGTHLLIEIKMPLPWDKVNQLLDKYGLANSNRVMFDTAKVDLLKTKFALKAAQYLHAPTGAKDWPEGWTAEQLRPFGNEVRVTYDQAIKHGAELRAAGMKYIFAKVANGWDLQTPQDQWSAIVTSGMYDYMITERSKEYLDWCAEQRMVRGTGPTG